ncbi:hypothetical protein GW17_00062383 [Ensete ventricosum]|nr:hypothetical protein GW17_00062383 [Ensete ventricosum]RZR97261.1 hypothetical protein BHM03_00026403 [Ensete ventricosum]
MMVKKLRKVAREVEFRSVFHAPSPKFKILAIPKLFRAPSRKFKILAIPNVLDHEKSYEHGFAKKHDSHKLYTKLCMKPSFDWFITYRLRNSKYWSFPMY